MSETAKTRHIVEPLCQGNGVDLGSGGDPIVPWAIQFDLHRHHKPPAPPVQFVADIRELPFIHRSLDFVYASHVLEDFPFDRWRYILSDWISVVKKDGYLIIQVPDHERFRAAVAKGQPDNLAHQHESHPGELTQLFNDFDLSACMKRWDILLDQFEPADDYNVLFVARRVF